MMKERRNNMEHEESIDLGRLMQIMLERKKIVGGIIASCTVVALGYSFALPKEYSSTTVVQMRSVGKDISAVAAMATVMGMGNSGGASGGSPSNYIELMKTRRVLDPVINSIYGEESGENKERPEAEGFAKKNLKIENTKQTNLITVTGKGRTPEEAQQISKGVVDGFLAMQTEMNQQTQSLLVQFLNERIETAKKEADEAALELANFQREHKIVKPDDQGKSAIEQLEAYDKAIGEKQVEEKAAQAEYDAATQTLNAQKVNSQKYQISDNSIVTNLRNKLVDDEVKIVSLRQQYTDKHPDVVALRKEMSRLQQEIANEISTIVNSDAASLNDVQASMLTKQAEAESKVSVARASERAIKAKKEEKEKEFSALPEVMMTYIQLESDAKMKQDIYSNLVQKCEQDKIQEAMESMDVQVIDAADFPKRPSGPNHKLITMIGLLVGCFISFTYSFVCYKREM